MGWECGNKGKHDTVTADDVLNVKFQVLLIQEGYNQNGRRVPRQVTTTMREFERLGTSQASSALAPEGRDL